MRKNVYNLDFPSGCQFITIFGYKFSKVKDYPDQLQRLQHLVAYYADVQIKRNTGQHAITAHVELPKKEQKAILEWGEPNSTALSDVLLLLSLFTQREVFVIDDEDSESIILADPRQYSWGGILSCSIPYKEADKSDGDIYPCNIGFEEGINNIYSLIRSKEWQNKYRGGYFLFLAKQAFHRQSLEASFIQCWTIWEYLFSILNQNWLSDKEIRRLEDAEKISFVLTAYALKGEVDNTSRKRINSLAEIRHRLVHFGRFPDRETVHDDAILFIRVTEFVLAKILGLTPSNVFNTIEKLEHFLAESGK